MSLLKEQFEYFWAASISECPKTLNGDWDVSWVGDGYDVKEQKWRWRRRIETEYETLDKPPNSVDATGCEALNKAGWRLHLVDSAGSHWRRPKQPAAPAPIKAANAGATTKDTNPKQAFADGKIPLDIVPETAISLAALAHLDGALKYGRWNWRKAGVRASTYVAAARRHLMAWNNGEEDAPDGVPHLAHALACLNIIVDSMACGKLNDDRPPRMDVSGWMAGLTKWVPIIRKRHEGKTPRDWTIADKETD